MTREPKPPAPIALVIDDETQIRRLLRLTLEANEYRVFEDTTGKEGLAETAQRRPDVVLLDLGLPDLDGIAVLKQIREWSRVPVIILSVRGAEDEKIAALDNGADDYVTKPFSTGELLARLRVVMRRHQGSPESTLFTSGPLSVDLVRRVVSLQGRDVHLTATEYGLLRLFIQHAGKVLTQRQIMREVWGPKYEDQTHYLRVYMTRLREKLERTPSEPELFLTEPGVGYRLVGP